MAAISGGVDSAVAAARLVRGGADVVGVHLRTGVEADGEAAGGARSCCGADDARDARAVATRLGIPFYVVDVQGAFRRVIDDFVASYAAGRTPSPCVLCNRWVKFGRLKEIAADLGAEVVATGHYARTARTPAGRVRLLRAVDRQKDQTYMLFRLDQDQLASARFPLGDTVKDEVRAEARALGLGVVSEKPDSQELCFLPAGGPRAFLRARAPEAFRAGTFESPDGTVLGTHDGALGFTPGQRRGLPSVGTRQYVHAVEPEAGRVVIGDRAALAAHEVRAADVNWIDATPEEIAAETDVVARIRHAGEPAPGHLTVPAGDGSEIAVRFDDPVFAAAAGQALVAYRGEAVLCGGSITATARSPGSQALGRQPGETDPQGGP